LKEILDGSKAEVFRVLFNEITPKAIRAAIEAPGRINQNIVDAQQARRILDLPRRISGQPAVVG
jgi:DNA topoisomerase-1